MPKHHRSRHLTTFNGVVKALGGKRNVGIMTKTSTADVCNWKRRRGRFPTKYYLIMKRELEARRVTAPDHLWGFFEEEAASSEADAA